MEGKIRIGIDVSIPAGMKNEEIFNLLERGIEAVQEILEEEGIIVDKYRMKLTVG